MVPPYQLVGVPVVPPYHLTKIFKLCKTSFYEFESHCFDERKDLSSQFKAKFECYKNWSKTGGVLCSPLTNW